MYEKIEELIVTCKNENKIKEIIFTKYPQLRAYTNNAYLEREFGKNEKCGNNRFVISISPLKRIVIDILYVKEIVNL